MAENKVEFIINIGGAAYKGVAALDTVMGKLKYKDIVFHLISLFPTKIFKYKAF